MNLTSIVYKIRSTGRFGMWFADRLWDISALWGHPNCTNEIDLAILKRVARDKCANKWGVMILEIGSWMGCSSIPLAEIVREQGGRLYCCDRWDSGIEPDLRWISGWKDIFRAFWKRMGKHGLKKWVIPLHGLSQDILPLLKSKSFDYIYIDGNHTYNGVMFDIIEAKRLIKSNGVIAGHDYYIRDTPDVVRAVDESFKEFEHEGRIWWFIKH